MYLLLVSLHVFSDIGILGATAPMAPVPPMGAQLMVVCIIFRSKNSLPYMLAYKPPNVVTPYYVAENLAKLVTQVLAEVV